MNSASATAPGFYLDASSRMRFWNGTHWTEHVLPLHAVAPTLPAPRTTVVEEVVSSSTVSSPLDEPDEEVMGDRMERFVLGFFSMMPSVAVALLAGAMAYLASLSAWLWALQIPLAIAVALCVQLAVFFCLMLTEMGRKSDRVWFALDVLIGVILPVLLGAQHGASRWALGLWLFTVVAAAGLFASTTWRSAVFTRMENDVAPDPTIREQGVVPAAATPREEHYSLDRAVNQARPLPGESAPSQLSHDRPDGGGTMRLCPIEES